MVNKFNTWKILRVYSKHKANMGSKRENREVAEKQCSEI